MTFGRNGAFIHLAAGDEVWWAAQIAGPAEPERCGVDDAEWLRRAARLFAGQVA